MKAEILERLGRQPATLGDLCQALGVPQAAARKRAALLSIVRQLVAAGQVVPPERRRPWYQLPQKRAANGTFK